MTFYTTEDAVAFFDAIDTAKGPSLGTNFTLTSPYAILAHYGELEWVYTLFWTCDFKLTLIGCTVRRRSGPGED